MKKQAIKPSKQKDGLVKRGTKWAYVLRIPDPVTGKTKQKWISGFDNEKEAKFARDKARVNISTGIYITPSKITVEEFLGTWIELHVLNLKPSTEASYRVNLNSYLLPYLGHIPLANLRPSHIQKFYADLRREGGKDGNPLSAKSVQNAGAVLKKALQYAVDVDGLLVHNPASRVPLPKGQSQHNETWTASEFQLFLAGITDHRLFAFFRLSAYSGARRGELLALRWSDFDSDGKRFTISKNRVKTRREVVEQNSTKGGDGRRIVSLDDRTVEILKAHRKRQLEERLLAGSVWNETGYIFTREDGEPIDPDTPSQLFTRFRINLGLPSQRLHDLRHFHATELLRAGVPLHVVADRLGHRDAMVTATIYAHVRADQAESVAEIFAKAIK